MSDTKALAETDMDRQRAMLIGRQIYKARSRKWSQVGEGATALNLPASTLSNYERGVRIDVLGRWMNNLEKLLAPILGVNVNYLLGRTDDACTEQVWWANQNLGKEISERAGSPNGLFPFQLGSNALQPQHAKGEVLLFEPTDTIDPRQGGLYAVEVDGVITPRIFSRNISGGGWKVKDGISEELIDDEALNTIKIKGIYRCKITDL